MSFLRSSWMGLAVGLVTATAGVARADTIPCVFVGGGATPPYACDRHVCTDAEPCPEVWGPDAVCGPLVAGGEAVCHAPCATIFGCGASTDCPRVADSAGDCVEFGPSSTGGGPLGVCIYPDVRADYCAPSVGDRSVLPHYFSTCHTTPRGEPTSNYFLGDCDGDGCPNGADSAPCVADDGVCGAVVIGGDCAPTVIVVDAGAVDVDASVPDDDGGKQDDAGGEDDAGSQEDAGTNVVPMDAGTSTPPVSFHGGGGCTCTTGGRAHTHGALAIALALLFVIRRRAR